MLCGMLPKDDVPKLSSAAIGFDCSRTGLGAPDTPRDASNASVGSIGAEAASPGSGAQASSTTPNVGVPDLPMVGVPGAGVLNLSTLSTTIPSSSTICSFFCRLFGLGSFCSIDASS